MPEELEDVYIFVAERIRLARKQAKLTQEELADKVNMSRTSIVNIEAFRQRIMLHQITEISKATNVEISYFLPRIEGNELSSPQESIALRQERMLFDRSVRKAKTHLWKVLTELDEIQ